VVLEHGAEHGLDTSRIAVAGESVGGCMSVVFALMNKERGGVDRRAQVLLHSVVDADFDTPSSLQFAEGYYPTRDGMKWFWDASTTDDAQRTEVYVSPLQASLDQLRGLPIILVITDEAAADETDGHILSGGPPFPCRSRPVGL
jgi:acetyl esterase/lipase